MTRPIFNHLFGNRVYDSYKPLGGPKYVLLYSNKLLQFKNTPLYQERNNNNFKILLVYPISTKRM